MNCAPNIEMSMFSWSENCCRIEPAESTVDAMRSDGSRSTTATDMPGERFFSHHATLHPITPPPTITVSKLREARAIVGFQFFSLEIHFLFC